MKIKEGLYQEIIHGTFIDYSRLYTDDGYVFYELPQNENDPLLYLKECYTSETDIDLLNQRFICQREELVEE